MVCIPLNSTKDSSFDSSSNAVQKSLHSSSDSCTSLTRNVSVSFVAASAIVRMTCTRESDATLFAKSYGRQGSEVSLARRSSPSGSATKSRQWGTCWKKPSRN